MNQFQVGCRRVPLLVALFGLTAGAAPVGSRFEKTLLTIDGALASIVASDLDGDGRNDVLAVYARGVSSQQTRHVAIFWNTDGAFASKPDQVIDLEQVEPQACAFDVAQTDAVAGAELILVSTHGVSTMRFQARKPSPLTAVVREETMFYQPSPGQLPRMRVAQLMGPGQLGLLIPTRGTLGVYTRNDGGYAKVGSLAVELRPSTEQGSHNSSSLEDELRVPPISIDFPRVQVVDTEGDGRKDVVLSRDDSLAIYRQSTEGTFGTQPDLRRDFATRTPEELTDDSGSAGVTLADIDNDGIIDVVARKQVRQGFASSKTTTFLYFGRKGGTYPEKADQVIRNEGAKGPGGRLVDLTGDGHPDLLVPSTTLGLLEIIRILTTKTLKFTVQVFPFDSATRKFLDQPVAERDVKLKVSLSGQAQTQVYESSGDFNGDKRPDLLIGTGDDEVSIFPGAPSRSLFSESAVETIAVGAFGQARVVDLNRQGKDDIILIYPDQKGHRGDLVLLRNRGPW